MPIDIQSLRQKGVKVEIPFFEGDPVVVIYDPIKVSDPDFRSRYNQRARELQHELTEWSKSRVADAAEHAKARQEAKDGEEIPEYEADAMGYSRRIWMMRAELVEMLIKDWEIEDDGKRIPVSAEVFTNGTLPPELAQAIQEAVWEDVRALGNPNSSSNTR